MKIERRLVATPSSFQLKIKLVKHLKCVLALKKSKGLFKRFEKKTLAKKIMSEAYSTIEIPVKSNLVRRSL
jgi:hypothetical protein